MGKFKLKLSFLIVSMAIIVVLAASSISIWSSYLNFNEILQENKKDMKETYVKEVSTLTTDYLQGSVKDDRSLEPYMEQIVDTLLDERAISFSLLIKKTIIHIIIVVVVVLGLAIWLAKKLPDHLRILQQE